VEAGRVNLMAGTGRTQWQTPIESLMELVGENLE
jgi:hypothetical protein